MEANEQAIQLIFEAIGKVEVMNNLVPDDLLDEANDKLYEAMNLLAEDMQSNVRTVLKDRLKNPTGDIDKWLELRVKDWQKEAPKEVGKDDIDELTFEENVC